MADQASRATRFLVSGTVQGVRFRASTRDFAHRLGLHGYARNLPDGRVEVVARGDREAIERLAESLQQGPPLANVASIERHDGVDAGQTGNDFRVA